MRSDQASASLVVDGRDIPILFSTRSGGNLDSQESKFMPGAMQPERALGGTQTVENVTLSGEYRPELHEDHIQYLKRKAGKGDATVTEQSLDADGNSFGRPQTWVGVLKAINTGDYDASSGDARLVELEISTHGRLA